MPSVLVDSLTVRFGSFTAVDKVSFAVEPGEIFGFLGANGAGKTTTIRALCGLVAPSAGRATVAGVDVAVDPLAVKRLVGYMSQKFTLWMDLSVAENLAFAGSLRRMPSNLFARRRAELAELVGFDAGWDRRVGDLPGGLRQQVSLMAALLHEPEVVFLDEPTAGVSPSARARFWELIRLVADQGRTVFVTTHYMDEAEQCGRIALMRDGRLIALDAPAALKRTAFPTGLVEAEAADGGALPAPQGPGLGVAKPHGRRWHIEELEPGAWGRFAAGRPDVVANRVEAGLEDVFLKLVEARHGGE